jgi:hypothetical protein
MPDPDLGEPQDGGKEEALTLLACILVAGIIVAVVAYYW